MEAVNENIINNNNNNTNDQQQNKPITTVISSSSNSSNFVEVENQFLLRFPTRKENGQAKAHPAVFAIREALNAQRSKLAQSGEETDPLKDRLFIEINPETRKGRVKFDNEIFNARLVDLPCIIESLKTRDKKMFYKTADICQMLVCKTEQERWTDSDEDGASSKQKLSNKKTNNQLDNLNRKYQWPHGITPPLKNVRRKRFRKVAKKKIIDYAEIEKEVKQLFRADREAVKVDYEVVYVEGDPDDDNENDESKTKEIDNNSDDSSQDESSLMGSKMKKASSHNKNDQYKSSKKDLEESNLSHDVYDENSSSMTQENTNKNGKKIGQTYENTTTNLNDDEFTNDNSNMDADNSANAAASTSTTTKNRTNFKNLFVQVIGDLSSSDDGDEEPDEEEENEEDNELDDDFDDASQATAKRSGTKVNREKPSFENDESNMSNMDMLKSKSKYDEFDEDEEMGEENEKDDADDNLSNTDGDETQKNSNLSSPRTATDSKHEIKAKLDKLMEELARIQEERRKREIEITPINNPVLKAHLSSRLNNLIEEENKKKAEIDNVKALIDE